MLEELNQQYTLHPVNIGKGEPKAPDYLDINPNGRIPALFDSATGARVSVAMKALVKTDSSQFQPLMRWHQSIEKRSGVIRGLDKLQNLSNSRY
jgi:hypothetical protein